jgi:Glycosyl transferases group 1
MQKLVGSFWTTLEKDQSQISPEERHQALCTAEGLLTSWSEIDKPTRETVLQNLEHHSLHSCAFNHLLIDSIRYHVTKDLTFLHTIPARIDEHPDELAACASTFMTLAEMVFNDTGNTLATIINRRVFRTLFNKQHSRIGGLYDRLIGNHSQPFSPNNKVVILTRQFLQSPHAPTVDAINFATLLTQDFGKEVMIVASSEYTHANDGAIVPAACGAMIPEYQGGLKTINANGHSFPFLMCGDGIFGEPAAIQGIQAIDAFSPEMILCISAPSLLAEPFHHRCFCFIYPTARGVPLTTHCFFHTWDQPDAEMQHILDQENLRDKHLFAQHPGFEVKPPSTALTRRQFGIPEDAFLFVVVGIRLFMDIDDRFLKLLVQICDHPKAHIAFAGNFENYKEQVGKHAALKGRTTHLGFQQDIMGVYQIADAYLNPIRNGGGSAIVYALQAGLPVLSLPSGDAGMVVAGFPPLETYEDMGKRAYDLMTNATVLSDYQKLAHQEAPKFSGRKSLLDNIMQAFHEFAKRQG